MKSELFYIGNYAIHGYGFMIAIGFILAVIVGEIRAKRMKLRDEAVIDIALVAIVSGFLGAKLLYVIVDFKEFLSSPMSVLGSSGFVVYGGIISGVFFGWLYTRIKKLPFFEYFDLVMPEIALAQAFGRLGCFMAGCCYGRVTDSIFGVIFPEGGMAPAGVKLIPTQLISAAGDIINMAILMIVAHYFSCSMYKARHDKKESSYSSTMDDKDGDNLEKVDCDDSNIDDSIDDYSTDKKVYHLPAGAIGCLYLILYGIGRFLIEFLRDDHRGTVGILSTSQFISLFIVLIGVGLIILVRRIQPTATS